MPSPDPRSPDPQSPDPRSPDPEIQVRRIVADFNAGRHDAARLECEAALRSRPGDPVLNHLMAAVLFAAGNATDARGYADASLAANPGNPAALRLAGRIADVLGDFAAAVPHLERAAALKPDGPTLAELARALDAAGDRRKAEAAWHAAAKADPGSREAAARLGRILYENGQLAEALSLLERAVAGDGPASAWFDLGLVRHDLRDHAGAADAYRRALEKQPGDAEAAVNLGVALQDGGDVDAAMAAYGRAYALRPETFGTIAMALTSAPTGALWLDREELKRRLNAVSD